MSDVIEAPPPSTAPADPAPAPAAAAPPDWRASLPPELREAPSIAKFQDPAALAKSYAELETLIGRKGLVIPGEKDSPEVHARFRQALGVPEKPEGYEIKPPEGIPEGLWSDDSAKAFAAIAHKHGLTPAQASGIAAEFLQAQAGTLPNPEEIRAKAETELRQEWGAAFGAKIELAKRAARQFGGEEFAQFLDASGLGNNPQMARMLARIGETMGEDQPAGMGQGRGGVMTPAEAKAERTKLMADPKGPYWDRFHPEHKAAVERVTSLIRMEGAAA